MKNLKTKSIPYTNKAFTFLILGMLFSITVNAQSDSVKRQGEADYYKIHTVPIPESIMLEVGGMTFLPNDILAVTTRRGEVWLITNPYMKDGLYPKYRLFAQGLHEALGINYIDGDIYITQRSELTRLRDLNGDGVADEYRTIVSWPLQGNYHQYAYGPMLTKDGKMLVARNLGWIDYGESLSKWDGWMLEVGTDGQLNPFATGMRSPAGMALNNAGDIFYSENQGDWVGSGSITHVAKGDFVGNPAGLIWAGEPGSPVALRKEDIPDTGEPKHEVAKRVKGLKTPAVWFPHTVLGISTSDILSHEGYAKMGPFEGQLFVGDQGQSKIMRVFLEKTDGVYQGVVFPFREGFSSGILRMKWGSDGSMLVGMTSRGWNSTGPDLYGLQRLEWNGKLPFEMKSIQAKPDGFEIEFTRPVDINSAKKTASYQLTSFTYKYHHQYGSPPVMTGSCPLKAIAVSADGMRVRLVTDSLREGFIHEIKAEGVTDTGKTGLLHTVGYYTLNKIPEGQKLVITDDNRVTTDKNDHRAHHNQNNSAMLKEVVASGTGSKSAAVSYAGKRTTQVPGSWKNGAEQHIIIGTMPGLKFDKELITAKAGEKIKLTFNNNDDMLHNLVITTAGSADEVGDLAAKMGLNGERLHYVPSSNKVLHYTHILQPGKKETIYFNAPEIAGEYPFICTYPGHYIVMKGILRVIPK